MLHWYTRGPGTPVVLLHGFTGAVQSWAAVAERLPRCWPVCALALPGHAVASRACADFSATCRTIVTQLQALKRGPVHLVGYSLGGRLALGVACAHPHWVCRATFVGVHPGLADRATRQARRAADALWVSLLRTAGCDVFAAAWEKQPILAVPPDLHMAALAAQAKLRRSHDPASLADCLQATGLGVMPNWTARLPRLGLPSQWISGARDAKFSALAQQAAQLTPGARCYTIADCGHNPLIEAPAVLATLIAAFHRHRDATPL